MASTLIVYYSMTGTARRIAELLQQMTQWPALEVSDPQPRGKFRADNAALDYALRGPDASQFERLVVIAPAWLGELAPPLHGLLRDLCQAVQAPRVKPVSLICVAGLDGVAKVVADVTRLVGKPPQPLLILSHDDVADASCVKALQALAEMVCAIDGAALSAAPQD